ncbi:hypothetical protein L873DRAFT_669229 [Choiromyces venosus 120613-1]|uniref:Uncharacterized protein n=1 Tax=Choiromyces venosus 120613-1 TaxID=1336337 RepID=A0A3N4JYR1_9PEZI|nr:hypothetical protein L873DRAFT_669229 [Choiromyces venosus 120613-1]
MAAFLSQHPIPCSQGRERIFESVFLSSASSTLPTPLATPSSSSVVPPSQPSQTPAPSYGYNTRHHPNVALSRAPISLAPSPAAIFARESRAWHLATTKLSFPADPFPGSLREYVLTHQDPMRDVAEAIRYLTTHQPEDATPETSLLEWYSCEVRRHFLAQVRLEIPTPTEYKDGARLLEGILGRLTTAHLPILFENLHHSREGKKEEPGETWIAAI